MIIEKWHLQKVGIEETEIEKFEKWEMINTEHDKFFFKLMRYQRFDHAIWLLVELIKKTTDKRKCAVYLSDNVYKILKSNDIDIELPWEVFETTKEIIKNPHAKFKKYIINKALRKTTIIKDVAILFSGVINTFDDVLKPYYEDEDYLNELRNAMIKGEGGPGSPGESPFVKMGLRSALEATFRIIDTVYYEYLYPVPIDESPFEASKESSALKTRIINYGLQYVT